jgi:hypothetical protein
MFTEKDLEKLKNKGLIRGYSLPKGEVKKRSKYGAEKVEIDGKIFDSKRESKRYCQLKYLEMTGEITDLLLQVEFELNPGGTHSLIYRADFVYKRNGEVVVNDVKGYRTKEYKKKKRLMKSLMGIEILET